MSLGEFQKEWRQAVCLPDGHRMYRNAHLSILWQQNKGFSRKTCHRMKIPATFFILWQENESGSGRIGRIVLSAGNGAEELSVRSWRKRRSFLPAALRGALGKALLASPRKTSWAEAAPAAVWKSLSPVQQLELYGWLALPSEDIFLDGSSSGSGGEEFISRPPAGDLYVLPLTAEDKLTLGIGRRTLRRGAS